MVFAACWVLGQGALILTAARAPTTCSASGCSPRPPPWRSTCPARWRAASSRRRGGEWSARDASGQLRHFSWHDRVRDPVLASLDQRVFASYGVDAQLARVGRALDDVADHVPEDGETLAPARRGRRLAQRPRPRDDAPGEPCPPRPPDAGALARWRDETGDAYALGAVRLALGVLLLLDAFRAAPRARGRLSSATSSTGPCSPKPSSRHAVSTRGSSSPASCSPGSSSPARAPPSSAAPCSARTSSSAIASSSTTTAGRSSATRCSSPSRRAIAPSACARGPARAPAPLWAARLAQLQVSLVYVASGGSKLLDPDWRGGRVLLERFHLYGSPGARRGRPGGARRWLSRDGRHERAREARHRDRSSSSRSASGRAARGWSRSGGASGSTSSSRRRAASSPSRGSRSPSTCSSSPPTCAHARSSSTRRARPAGGLARAVARLDWLARFEVATVGRRRRSPERARLVVDRDGSRATGAARRRASSRAACRCSFRCGRPLALVVRCTRRPAR